LTNRLSLVPRIAEGDAEADQTLVWSMTAEIVLGVIIVILAGFLGLSSPMAG
jgi:putative copper export protein